MPAKPTLNPDQKEAFNAIQKFLEHPSANVFVLKGYAGTGKTFLMQQLAKWLTLNEQAFVLLASREELPLFLKVKLGL